MNTRHLVRSRFCELLASGLPDVRVDDHSPEDLEDEHVWVGQTAGSVSNPVAAAPPTMYRDDVFAFELGLRTFLSGREKNAAIKRLAELVDAVAETCRSIRATPTLIDSDDTGLLELTLSGEMEGPDVEGVQNGFIATAGLVIQVHCRLS